MSQQTQPNPVALFEGASSSTTQLLAGVKSDHLNSPPGSEWTVNDLIRHIQGGPEGLAAKLSGSSTAGAQGGSDAVASYKAAVSRTLEAAKDPANLEKSVDAGGTEMPGGQFLSIMFLDHLVHYWDLAKATGQDTVIDPALVDACYGMFFPAIDQFRSDRFGVAVTVSDTASTHDKLIAFMGRQP
jgi:uncharacterized protein (TIGR03086 family)